jgi:CBS domain-containing protein
MDLKEAIGEAVSVYASSSFAQVAGSDSVSQAARTMQKAGATEAIVMGEGKPVGIVTERDILYKVVAVGSDPSSVKVKDVMTSPVETIEEGSKVGDAIAKMSRLGVRRLGVTRKGRLVGMITQKAVASSDLKKNVPLPELASPHQFTCPYCDAAMKTKEELSKHIDQVHLGLGLLEGDTSKW